jgi:hypothetical protein
LLIPPKPGSGLHRTLGEYAASIVSGVDENVLKVHPFWTKSDFPTKEVELAAKRAWRVGPTQMEELRAMARKFEGTHNFHNFTVARDFSDRSNKRHMKKIEVSEMSDTDFLIRSWSYRSQIPLSTEKQNGSVSSFMDKVSCCIRSLSKPLRHKFF